MAYSQQSDKEQRKRSNRTPVSFLMLNPNPNVAVDFDANLHFTNPAAEAMFPGLEAQGPTHAIFLAETRPWSSSMPKAKPA